MAKKKVKVKKIKMPLWQDIVYMALIAVAPIVITCLELFQSHSSTFKWSFASIGAILTTFIIIKKYLLNKQIDNLEKEVFELEHDYSVANGDEKLIEAKWRRCKMILYAYNAIVVLLSLILVYLFVNALVDGLIAFKGAITLILIFVFSAMIFKAICYYGGVYEDEQEDNNSEESNE